MSDYNSSLPVRTENAGDVIAKIADATTPSQQLAVDASGKIIVKLDDGAGNAITSQTNGAQRALDVGIDVAGVQIDPRQIRTLTSSDTVNVNNLPATVDTNYGTVGASTIRTASEIGNATGAANFNFGAAGAQTLRVAALPGNASGLADFNNGATGAQTPRVAANLAVGGADVTASNPVPVTLTNDNIGTEINDYNTSAALAAAASSNHDYTVTAAKTLLLSQISAAASGKMKIEVRIETAAGSGTFNTKFVCFNSTANPNIDISLRDPISVVAGAKVRIIRTNNDNQSQDVYSTISGQEIP